MDRKILESLYGFINIAKFGSLNKAASVVGLEHKTLRAKIQDLEFELNRKLINSSSQGTLLTEDGWDLYNKISSDFSNIFQNYMSYRYGLLDAKKVALNILFPPVTSLFFTIHVLPKLRERHPELIIKMTTLNIEYLQSYGSHIKNIINSFNILMLEDLGFHLINQDEWHLAMSVSEKLRLYASEKYIVENDITQVDGLDKAQLIFRQGSDEEFCKLKYFDRIHKEQKIIKFNHSFIAENDLIKCHMIDQGLGIGLLSNTLFKCGQGINLVEVFPEYNFSHDINYSLIYKKHEVEDKYIKSIVEFAREKFEP